MSGGGFDERKSIRPQDSVWRIVAGCAGFLAVLGALVVVLALLIGWRLGRDESPPRPEETFLVGDEARYWSVSLRPDDAGLKTLFARADEINDATRQKVLRGTFLEAIPFPHRAAKLDDIAPLALELALSRDGWAARGTFSHSLFRMRAALKIMRFIVSHDEKKAETVDVDGIPVTVVHDKGAGFAVATLGSRVLVASDVARMRTVLRPPAAVPHPALSGLLARHDGIKLPNEDAWAFDANPILGQDALLSFDVNDNDELAFRAVVAGAFGGTPADCAAVVARFVPGLPPEAIAIEAGGARDANSGSKEFSGRIAGLSKRLAGLLARATELRRKGTLFASPSPPSLPTSADPQSGTPVAPMREGTPTPRR
jgi:hypothetical protein